jgi:hypothetical protein
MSNRFYNFVSQLIAGSIAKSSEVNTEISGIDDGFDAVELELNRAIKFPAAESSTNQEIVELPAARQGYMLGFDLNGELDVNNKFLIDWNMNSKRLRNLVTAVAADEPVTLAQLQAYSVSLVAGLPTIVAQNGPLTTDGATVIWDSVNKLVPTTASVSPGSEIVYSASAVKWLLPNPNLVFDPNGAMGTDYWSSTLNAVVDYTGYIWRNTGSMTTQTFTHTPTAAGYIVCQAAAAVTASVTISTGGTTAGTIGLALRYYDNGLSLISESSATSITMATSAETRYVKTATTPSLTEWIVPILVFTGVSAAADGVRVRDMKLERGSDSTPYNDTNTLVSHLAYKAANTLGYGFTTPILTLGNATATTAAYNMRSEAGSQAYDVRFLSTGGTNGTVGKGVLAISSKTMTNTGPIGYASEYDAGNSGSSKTIDFLNGAKQKLTLSAATPAITVSTTGLVVGQYQLKVVQDSGTARVPTWVGFAAGDCVGNAFPVMTTTLSGITFVYFYWDGTQFWVSSSSWD